MGGDALDRFEQLFRAAQMHPPEERAAFLEAACADDAGLRAELESLLVADVDADSDAFLADLPTDWDAALHAASTGDGELDGAQVGPYRVLRPLGRGGMGDVYLAVREEPFRRYVALKVIRQGSNSRDVLARFAIERQILASLDHPGIARLLDGGVTEDGSPYFAMEYVDGQAITAYCDERRLTIPERLRLFLSVCEAVHFAHQNLVLHRDLKPSNILVTPGGAPKLLDFGIAKLLNPQLSHLTVPVTRAESRMLTPEYASPEQLRDEPLATTSDVYSLGVLLYELLTGRRPHHLAGRSTQEMIRIVSDESPENPSTAVTRTLSAEASRAEPNEVASARDLTTDRLQRRLRGDLDALCLKALRKEPNKRYGSAELLAQDVERHLDRQPVSARRGNKRYRLASFLRRHRVETAAAAVVLFALVGGLGVALWQAGEARQQRDRAEVERVKAEEVAQLLRGLFEAYDPYAPSPERLDTLDVGSFLERSADQVMRRLEGQPVLQAQMLDVVGRVHHSLGLHEEAEPMLQRSLELRRGAYAQPHPEVAESLNHLAALLNDVGDYKRARLLLEEALAMNVHIWGADHPNTAASHFHLGNVLQYQGQLEEADEHHHRALSVLRETAEGDDPRLAQFTSALATTLEREGDYDSAERLARESLALHRTSYGSEHPQLAVALRDLGLIRQRQGDYAEAESLFREALSITESTLNEEHPQVADLLNRLASVRWWQKDYAAADSIHRRSIALKRKIYGDNHVEISYGLNNLASVLRDKGEFEEAESLLRESVSIAASTVGNEHSDYWIVLSNLGKTLWARGACQEAEPLLREAIQGMRLTIPHDTYRVPVQQRYRGDCLRQLGRYAEAEALLMESYTVLERTRGSEDELVRETAAFIATLYQDWNKPAEENRYRTLAARNDVLSND